MAGDPGPMARLEVIRSDVDAPAAIFSRVSEGETLQEVAVAWGLPKGAFVRWYTEAHAGLYDTALKVRADALAHEALADANSATSDDTAPKKLRVETKLKLAGKWDRQRYGDREAAAVQVVVNIADVPREIAALEERLGLRVVATQPALTVQEEQTTDMGAI